MTDYYFQCSDCSQITSAPNPKQCPLCQSANGKLISGQEFKNGIDSGIFRDPFDKKRKKKST